MEKIIVEKVTRDDRLTLRLECLKLATQTLPQPMLTHPNILLMLEARADALMRYIETGSVVTPSPPPAPRMRAVPPDDDEEQLA